MRRYLLQFVVSIITLIALMGCLPLTQFQDSPPQLLIQSLLIDADVYPHGWAKIDYQENDEDASLYDIENGMAFSI